MGKPDVAGTGRAVDGALLSVKNEEDAGTGQCGPGFVHI